MVLDKKWIHEDFVDLSNISNREFPEIMTAAGHRIKPSSQTGKDFLFEIEIPDHRPDCNSMIGLAREVAAAFQLPMQHHEPMVLGDDTDSIYNWLDVDITADELCNRYTARMVSNIQIAPSPAWLCQRLLNSGITPVNNIVDISNYVMLEYGQPIHVFDYRHFSFGSMIIREAAPGETLTALDGTVHTLQSGMPVIANDWEPVSPAAITGFSNCEINGDTTAVVIGAGNFHTDTICNTALNFGIPSAASLADIDPLMTVPAVQRACELVEFLKCGNVLDGIIDVLNYVPEPRTLEFQPSEINRILGSNLSEEEIIGYLKRLEISVSNDRISLPSFRSDLINLSDIAGEIRRLQF